MATTGLGKRKAMSKQRLFSYKFRFYPTLAQEVFLNQTLGCARKVYNKALSEHKEERKVNPKAKWSFKEVSKKLTAWKKDPKFFYLVEAPAVALQQSALNVDRAMKNFFRGFARFPNFKKKGRTYSITLTKNAFRFINGELFIAKVKEPLPVVYSRPFPKDSELTSITITKKSSGRWFVSFKLKGSMPPEFPKTDNSVGIDLGLESFLTTDKGFKVENPRFYRKFQRKLAKEQRRLSKKKYDSKNYHRQN